MLALIETRSLAAFTLPCGKIYDAPTVANRMAHLCVFCESSFFKLRKTIRQLGFLKYTHVVLEFWGTFPYRVNKSLYRKQFALTRAQIKTLVQEANAFGIEIIPMLNIWGHASQHRGGYGKHVSLDQTPNMQPYFNKTGWIWNILCPEVKALQCQMIDELIDACGDGAYFHIGCDEASAYGEERAFAGRDRTVCICDHINAITAHLKEKNRRPLMWGDMLLCNPDWGVEQNGESPESVDYLCRHLDRDIVMVDWQYGVKGGEIPSAKFLANVGFTTMIATWADEKALACCAQNVAQFGYFGLMQTTWDLLGKDMIFLARGAMASWNDPDTASAEPQRRMHAVMAEFTRKLLPPKTYADSGISANELEWN